jgi:hypothetical protein
VLTNSAVGQVTVKFVELVTDWPLTVTATGPVVAFAGTVTYSVVAVLFDPTKAGVPLNVTVTCPAILGPAES